MEYENIIGTQIGIYQVLCLSDKKTKDRHRLYHVKCLICGWETDMKKKYICKTKKCKHKNLGGKYISQQKWKNKKLRRIFAGMLQRCYNSNNKSYNCYGAKGIKVCDEWLNNPSIFEEWALSNGYEDNLTIDRINSNKDYCPENCRWVTKSENSKYKSTTKILEVDGISHTGADWSKILNLSNSAINKMLQKYPKEQVKEFIRRRLENPNKMRKHPQSWMETYEL